MPRNSGVLVVAGAMLIDLSMGQRADELSVRISAFALSVLRMIKLMPPDVANDVVIRHVARSASGLSSNYRSACSACSRADFVAKLAVALEEADETGHWLWMAQELQIGPPARLRKLASEAKELRAILSASVSTARRNLRESTIRQRS